MRRPVSALLLPLTLLASCASEAPALRVRNVEPARQLARQAEAPPGALEAGWRVFQQRCASCHGERADGSGGGANLLLRLQGLGPQRFVDLVLRRYDDSTLPLGRGVDRALLVDEVVERRAGALQMPAWRGDPVTQAHVMDLYLYLSARAEGRLGEGRPAAR
jgi:cytochrome c553